MAPFLIMVEIVDVVATSHFDDPRIGSVSRKQRLRIAKPLANYLHDLGVIRYLDETAEEKKSDLTDPQGGGGDEQSALSPAGPASQKKTAKQSKKEGGQQS